MSTHLLGMDFGTGGAKVCITDAELNVVSYAFREYKIFTENPSWSEHDPENYWTVTCDMIRECLSKAAVKPSSIAGIAISSAMPAMVMVDEAGRPINRAYNLMDRRAAKQVSEILSSIGAKAVFELTGNRLEDHPALINLLWEKENRPEDYKRIWKILTISGFIAMRLTGITNMNYSEGPFFGVAYDIRNNRFDKEILSFLDISESLLPESITQSETIIGEVMGEAAVETGLWAGTPVCSGQADCNAGWIGAGATEIGDIQMNLGTCGNFGIIHKSTDFLNSMINFAYTIKDTNITVPTTTTGGQLLRFFRDGFCHMETAMSKLVQYNEYDFINFEAERISPGSEGLVVLPYLMGERTPIWDTMARGVIFGLSLNHSKAHIARAFMEAVAYALYDSFQLIKQRYKINYPIVLNEGGAKSPLWRRIITDVFNTPTVMVKNRVGAPYGDALLAGVATGVFPDYSIGKEKVEYIDCLEPDAKTHEKYSEYFQVYKSVYWSLKDDFKKLDKLRNL